MTSAAAAARRRPPLAVIFDLDGTLVDSLPGIHAAVAAVLADRGRPDPGLAAVRGWVGEGADRLVQRAFTDAGLPWDDGATAAWRAQYDRTGPATTRPRAGAEDLLRVLHVSGLRLALCTNKPQAPTEAIVEQLGWAGHLHAVVGARPGLAPKPDPAPVRAALQAVDCAPQHAVFVGDSPADAGAAQAAGVPLVLVRGGYSRVPVETLGADVLIDSLAALPTALAELFPPPGPR
jgi:phosphoglycolate phosphatase